MAQLQDLFQTHAVVKILDHLTLYKDFEYTKTDIANETGISRRTLYQVWPILERFNLVKVTKSFGMIKFYKLNTENPISRHLFALADKISFFEADKVAGVESRLISQAKLPTSIPSSQTQQPLRVTRKFILVEEEVKGSPSQVKELLHEMKDLTNGEIKTPAADSTEVESVKTKKGKKPLVFRLHSQMESL